MKCPKCSSERVDKSKIMRNAHIATHLALHPLKHAGPLGMLGLLAAAAAYKAVELSVKQHQCDSCRHTF